MTPEIQTLITQVEMLATLLVLGFFAQRVRLIKEATIYHLASLLTGIVLPCMLLNLIGGSGGRQGLFQLLPFFCFAAVMCAIGVGGAYLLSRFLGFDGPMRRVNVLVASFGNSGFLGVPIVSVMFPQLAGIYGGAYLMAESTMYWVFGPLIADCTDGPKKISFRRLLTPLTLSIVIGVIILLLDLPVNGLVFWDTIGGVGSCAKYLAALYIGLDLGRKGLKRMFSSWKLLVSCGFKLILLPLLGYVLFGKTGVIKGGALSIFVFLLSTPTGMAVPILAREGHGNDTYATAGTMLCTILSLITMPLVMYLTTKI